MTLNKEKALKMVMGDEDLWGELITLTRKQLQEAMPGLLKSSEEDSWKEIVFSNKIHALKGASGGCGAEGLYQAAAELESALKRKEFNRFTLLFSRFLEEADKFLEITESLINPVSSDD